MRRRGLRLQDRREMNRWLNEWKRRWGGMPVNVNYRELTGLLTFEIMECDYVELKMITEGTENG